MLELLIKLYLTKKEKKKLLARYPEHLVRRGPLLVLALPAENWSLESDLPA